MTDSSTEAAPVSISALHATLVHRDELPKDDKTGVASLSVGIVGLALIMVPFVTPALGLTGVCLGVVALAVSRRTGRPADRSVPRPSASPSASSRSGSVQQ